GYARVTTFMGERVADDLHAALDRLEKSGMQRLILDLRDNGGGSVAEAAHVAGEFLPRGAIVYTASGRKAEVTDTGRVQRSFSRHEYYRMARTERDTVGRPACRTDGGRIAYGGGGIYPDLVLADAPATPRWMSRLNEQQLTLSWSGSYVDGGHVTGTLDAFA